MDSYPYTETWTSLTVKEQRKVTRRANQARLPIPEILDMDVRYAEKRRNQEATQLIAAMHTAVAEVPAYVERPQNASEERYEFACICGWRKTLGVDDLASYYERPFAPCGCGWECVECVG